VLSRSSSRSRLFVPAASALAAILALVMLAAPAAGISPTKPSRVTLRLGFLPNVTHATALVGVRNGIFARALGSNVTLRTVTFNAGPAAVEAIFSGALDATYVGPNPTINAFQRSHGKAVRIISGAASGGASFVVNPDINGPADLKGKKIASPQLGGTQDVALRSWLKSKGLETDTSGGGDVSVVPQENAQTLATFKQGVIQGAWVPEPWASRLVKEGEGKVLVDERTLWPGGRFVTTQLIVRTKFLKDHRDVVKRLLEGQVEANDFVNQRTAEAERAANAEIGAITGKPLKDDVIAASFRNLVFTNDPIASSLRKSAKNAKAVGLLPRVDLKGIYDLKLLNQVLKAKGQGAVSG
jgi:NitT/TauT family transport system substrate-binding protein